MHYDSDEDYHYIGFTFGDDEKVTGKLKIGYLKKGYGQASGLTFFKKYNVKYDTLEKSKYIPEVTKDDVLGKVFYITLRR